VPDLMPGTRIVPMDRWLKPALGYIPQWQAGTQTQAPE
jgi:hypothetical protein